MCPGAGKTFVTACIIAQHLKTDQTPVLILVHRDFLLDQWYHTLKAIGITSGINRAKQQTNPKAKVQIYMVQTACKRDLNGYGLVVTDECHHAQPENQYETVYKMLPSAMQFAVTATPYRMSGAGFSSLWSTYHKGPELDDLIEWGYATPIKYRIVSTPDLTHVKKSGGDYNLKQAGDAIERAEVLRAYEDYASGLKAMTFAVNVEDSKGIADKFKRNGIACAHIDASSSYDQRQETWRNLQAGLIRNVVNVGIATEGFDDPSIQAIILARPTKSLSLFHQMNRGTRVPKGVLDGAQTNQERRQRIADSDKPHCLMLDVAGCFNEGHIKTINPSIGGPSWRVDWESHFYGKGNTITINDPDLIVDTEDRGRIVVKQKDLSELKDFTLIDIVEVLAQPDNKKAIDYWSKEINIARGIGKPKIGYAKLHLFARWLIKEKISVTPELVQYIINDEATKKAERTSMSRRVNELEEALKGHSEWAYEFTTSAKDQYTNEEIKFLIIDKKKRLEAEMDRVSKRIAALKNASISPSAVKKTLTL